MSINRPDVNAKQMFFVGLLGLPWLWIVNVMYHWRAVYGKSDSTSQNDSNNENQGILAMMSTDDDDNEGMSRCALNDQFMSTLNSFMCIAFITVCQERGSVRNHFHAHSSRPVYNVPRITNNRNIIFLHMFAK